MPNLQEAPDRVSEAVGKAVVYSHLPLLDTMYCCIMAKMKTASAPLALNGGGGAR